jgi:hypothetical protein
VAAGRFDGDLGSGAALLTFLMATKGTNPQHGVLRWTWQDPHLRCFFEAKRARWSPTADVARPPCVVLIGPDLVLSLYRWCVVLQRHYGVKSCMVVAFSVRCCLFLLVPCQLGATCGGNDDCMSVRLLGGVAGLACRRYELCCNAFLLLCEECVAAVLISQSIQLVLG